MGREARCAKAESNWKMTDGADGKFILLNNMHSMQNATRSSELSIVLACIRSTAPEMVDCSRNSRL